MKQQYDDEYYRINVLGEDGDYTAGLVCKNWSSASVQETLYQPALRIYLTCDFNIDPNCWAVAHRYNGEYHFFDELCLSNTTTIQAADEFYRRYTGHSMGITITGDASGKNRGALSQSALDTHYTILRNRLLELGLPDVRLDVPSVNPNVTERVMSWNAAVCNTDGVVKIKVDPKCKWLIENCENLRYIEGSSKIWEPTLREIDKDPSLKYTKHIWDAASYLVHRYDPIHKQQAIKEKPSIILEPFRPR
jgi:hypothetical protein